MNINETRDQLYEEWQACIRRYWNQEQINTFDDIVRAWRWIIGYDLSSIDDPVAPLKPDMPLVQLKETLGCNIESHTETQAMIDKYIKRLKREYPLFYKTQGKYYLSRDSISETGLKNLIGYIDNGNSAILSEWKEQYASVFLTVN